MSLAQILFIVTPLVVVCIAQLIVLGRILNEAQDANQYLVDPNKMMEGMNNGIESGWNMARGNIPLHPSNGEPAGLGVVDDPDELATVIQLLQRTDIDDDDDDDENQPVY